MLRLEKTLPSYNRGVLCYVVIIIIMGCGSDHFLSHGKIQNEIEYVYVQDNYFEALRIQDQMKLWVDSFTQPSISNGVDL